LTELSHDSPATVALACKKVIVRAGACLFSVALTMVLAMSPIASAASAAEVKGTVVNGTTNLPGASDEVVLLSVSADGMHETARGKVDRHGHFSLPIADPNATQVVRVIHEGVTYHRMLATAPKLVLIKVYDVATRLEGVSAVMDVERFEASGGQLEVKQLITVRNSSQPPRTLMNDRPFEIQLPPDAHLESGIVQIEDGQPLKQKPVPGEQKGQYHFISPIRPGDTRFAVVYRLPYNGRALIEPQIRNSLERFVVMIPKSMKFEPKTADIFQPMPGTTPDNVLGTAPVMQGQTLAFQVSGTGTLEELEGRRQLTQAAPKVRPGGGLGPPIDAPAPLNKYRWQILASLTLLMIMGAAFTLMLRPRLLPASTPESATFRLPSPPVKTQRQNRRSGRRRRSVAL
jgi:hypothetical protein